MQDATAAQTQSAPQVSQTPQTSYVAQSSAQAPSVATSPQWVAPTTTQVAPAPQVQAQMGVQGYQSAPTAYSPQPQQASPQAENPYKDAFNRVVGAPEFTSPIPVPGSTVSSDTSSRPGQLRIPTNNPVQQSGSADLYAFEQQQPGVLQQLFPSFFGNNRPAAPSKRSK